MFIDRIENIIIIATKLVARIECNDKSSPK